MTIKQALLENIKLKWLYVNIIEKISENHYIVADKSALAIMEVASFETAGKEIIVGEGLKLIKPRKVDEDCFVQEEALIKAKPMVIGKVNQTKLEEMRQKAIDIPKPDGQLGYATFTTIIDNFKENDIVNIVLGLVISISRLIKAKYGEYRIVTIKDVAGTSMSMNLYEPHLEKLEENQVFTLTNLKKSIIKYDGNIRLTTTKFTSINQGNSDEQKLFNDYKIEKPVIYGCCIMFTDLFCYKSCPKHSTKLNVDAFCHRCNKKILLNPKDDFHCIVHIETQDMDDLTPILIFKNHLNISSNMCELKAEDIISQLIINQRLKIKYDKKGDSNIASKIEIHS